MVRVFAFGALLWLGALNLVQPAAAQGVFYDCDITQRKKDVDWVSPKLGVVIDAQGRAKVIDSVILHFEGQPVKVRARRRGDLLLLNWTLAGLVDASSQFIPSFHFSARLDLSAHTVTLRAKPVNFPQGWRGAGTCVTRSELPRMFRSP